jgi:hypothetical protein
MADAHLGSGLAADMVARCFAARPRFPAIHGRLERPYHADRIAIQAQTGNKARATPRRRRNEPKRKNPFRLKHCSLRNYSKKAKYALFYDKIDII